MKARDTYRTWKRIEDDGGKGYELGAAQVWDNGAGFGRVQGRWAVEVDGKWLANVDSLADAKALAEAELKQEEN